MNYDEITVEFENEITDECKKRYSDRLALIIFNQFGYEGAKWALEELKRQRDEREQHS